jgi:hypothetical protein
MKLCFSGQFFEGEGFVFQKCTRGREWRLVYKSTSYVMELRFVDRFTAVWLVFSRDKTLEMACVGKMVVSPDAESLIHGDWDLRDSPEKVDVRFVGKGELVDTWETSLGVGSGSLRWASYEVFGPPEIAGTYELLPSCGCAQASLHKNTKTGLFLFFDPGLCSKHLSDCFVFASTHHRLAHGEVRDLVARVHCSFRPFAVAEITVSCQISRLRGTGAFPPRLSERESLRSLALPKEINSISKMAVSCETDIPILKIVAPLTAVEKEKWVLNISDREKISRFSWLNSQMQFPKDFENFSPLKPNTLDCSMCTPVLPLLRWTRKLSRKHLTCEEDPEGAKCFEHAMKTRAPVFQTLWNASDEYDLGELLISVNPCALAHRAVALQEGHARQNQFQAFDAQVVDWRMVQTVGENDERSIQKKFSLKSNKGDDTVVNP